MKSNYIFKPKICQKLLNCPVYLNQNLLSLKDFDKFKLIFVIKL